MSLVNDAIQKKIFDINSNFLFYLLLILLFGKRLFIKFTITSKGKKLILL